MWLRFGWPVGSERRWSPLTSSCSSARAAWMSRSASSYWPCQRTTCSVARKLGGRKWWLNQSQTFCNLSGKSMIPGKVFRLEFTEIWKNWLQKWNLKLKSTFFCVRWIELLRGKTCVMRFTARLVRYVAGKANLFAKFSFDKMWVDFNTGDILSMTRPSN